MTLKATVVSPAGTLNVGTVTFTLLGIGTSSLGTVSGGSASASVAIPGGTSAGNYTIQAGYNGGSNLNSSTDTSHSLTLRRLRPGPPPSW